MKPVLRAAALLIATSPLAACSGGGVLGTSYTPQGNISVTDASTGSAITSSVAHPFIDGTPGFTIKIAESYYAGPYTASIVKWNNGFSIPCFTVTTVPGTLDTEFTLTDGNALVPGSTGQNPCVANQGDEETLQVDDGKGHTSQLYFVY